MAWLRHLPDVDYVPIPIVPELQPKTGQPVDLSYAFLRSVSLIYSRYLKNMGVKATMVMPLLKDGNLWGLISAMHHSAPRHVPYEIRTVVEFLAQILSLMVAAKEDAESFAYRLRMKTFLERIMNSLTDRADLHAELTGGNRDANIGGYIDSCGAALVSAERITRIGNVPSEHHLRELARWLATGTDLVIATDRLPQLYAPAQGLLSNAAGLLAIRLSKTPPEFVLWFRPEQAEAVRWAGDPKKPVEVDASESSIRLTPRTSFAPWMETVVGRSHPWAEYEVKAAADLRWVIAEVILAHDERLRRQADLLDQSHDAILAWKIGGGIAYWSRGAQLLYGYTPEQAIGRSSHELLQTIFPIPIQEIETQIARQGSWYGELVHTTHDGREIIVESRHVRVSYGGETYALETNRDITTRKHAEEELRKSEERFRSSLFHSPLPMLLFDDREQILALSQSWLKEAGYSRDELRRIEDWTTRAYGERSSEVLERIHRFISGEPEMGRAELAIRTKDGRERIWSFVSSALGTQSDGRRLFVCVAQDVTERKAHEEQVQLLMREVNHRAKNMLSVVQAIARQTAAREPEDFVERFSERIQALAANQDLLVRNEWRGVDVEDLVRAQLGDFADLIGARIMVRGPRLRLNAAASQAIGLALRELAINAAKFGALSVDAGCVDVGWQLVNDNFAMSWTEREGPLVSSPEPRGFGSAVITSMAERAVDGDVELDYAPSGLMWRLTCSTVNALQPGGREKSFH